ncbi:MAG: hypothetical protein KGJ80_02095, partial [Chloroflexota bacterium]|nr:hypothetical protein [Chloroflexota bacterium]
VASLSAAVLAPIAMFFFALNGNAPWSYFFVLAICGVLIIIVHIPNIKRLRAGTEKRFGERLAQRAPRDPASPPNA